MNDTGAILESMDQHEVPDEQIIARVRSGDQNAFEILVLRYEKYVYSVVCRYVPHQDVRTVAHDAFVESYKSLANYRGKAAFRHWLRTIAVRSCYKHLRERYRCSEVPMGVVGSEHLEWCHKVLDKQAGELFEREQERKHAREVLEKALAQLSAKNRLLVCMLHLEEISVSEAAELLGWSKTNVKVRAHRARKAMRTAIEKLLSETKRVNTDGQD